MAGLTFGLSWLKWGKGTRAAGGTGPPGWRPGPAGRRGRPAVATGGGGWGRGARAGPLPVLGVYHPRRLCSGWEEAAQGVGRWMSGWVWVARAGPISAG